MNKNFTQPKLGSLLLKLFLRSDRHAHLAGDLTELYFQIAEEHGKFNAFVWYWLQIAKSFPGFIINSLEWGGVMFKNYMKIAVRSMQRQKWYTFINLFGLAFGLASCILIYIWVQDELSFDEFHQNSDLIYRINSQEEYSGKIYKSSTTPPPLQPELNNIPEIEYAARVTRFGGIQVKYEDKSFLEDGARATDSEFFDMFTFSLIKGNPATVLQDPFSVLLTPETARKYFGEDSPIGKTLLIESQFEVTVTGIIEKAPHNSTIQYDLIFNFDFVDKKLERMPYGWVNAISTYIQLKPDADENAAIEKIISLIHSNQKEPSGTYSLMPIKDTRLHTVYGAGDRTGAIQYVYIFSIISVFVLLIACINFMNLSTARSTKRAKEVGVRKVVGAQKGNLVSQFFSESFLMTLFSMGIALVMILFLLPAFNMIANKEFSFTIIFKPEILMAMGIITVTTALISGSYPSLFLSSILPVKILKEDVKSVSRGGMFRKILVVIQFSLSIFLITGTLVIHNQMNFIRDKELGYNKDQVLYIRMTDGMKSKYKIISEEIAGGTSVLNVSACGRRPSYFTDDTDRIDWEGKNAGEKPRIVFAPIDFNFIETMEMEILEGRALSANFGSDSSGFILNEEAVKVLNIENPIGKKFSIFNIDGQIVGVVKDFHHMTLRDKIEPLVLMMAPNIYWLSSMVVKISPVNTEATLNFIEKKWEDIVPDAPFIYRFLDEDFEQMYARERRLSGILNYFSLFGIIIACLGLLGLVAFAAEQRTKEIGIRKVLGATSKSVINLLAKDFIILIVIANVIALPVAFYVMEGWLQDFAYRIEVGAGIFILASAIVLLVALITVSIQAFKAAAAKPVKSLRYE
jgi:ABC-type antimicrobial peptide transport system permease subunit